MPGLQSRRVSRELFLAAIGGTYSTAPPWVTDRLTAILEEEEVAAGASIYAEGEPPDHFFFLRRGALDLVQRGEPAVLIEGPRTFGILDVLIERPRSSAAYARVPLQLLRVRADAWFELLEDSFELARMSVIGLANGVAALEERGRGASLEVPAPDSSVVDAARPLDVVDRLAVLMRAPPLRGAGAQPISDLAVMCEEVSVAAGERLFERSASHVRVFVIVNGSVEATREEPSSTWRGGRGEVVCGFAAFAGTSSAWEARALTRTRALAFHVDDWLDILEENFEMVRAMLASLARENARLSALDVPSHGGAR